MSFELKDVVPWGRSFDEYQAMFGLTRQDFALNIMGCSDGPAAFNHQMTQMGHQVVSVDPLYQFTKSEIAARIEATFDTVLAQADTNSHQFVWDKIKSIQQLAQLRRNAMDLFLADYENGKRDGRYLAGELPKLPFADQQFDLALCSHFLFLYSAQFSTRFHLDAITELCRISGEVRVFPLLELGGTVSRHLQPVCDHLHQAGYGVEISEVDYEFQKGGNQLLTIHGGSR